MRLTLAALLAYFGAPRVETPAESPHEAGAPEPA
jgi:hypothetical protein